MALHNYIIKENGIDQVPKEYFFDEFQYAEMQRILSMSWDEYLLLTKNSLQSRCAGLEGERDYFREETIRLQNDYTGCKAIVDRLQGDRDQLQSAYNRLRASLSYRVGRAVTWLPRKLRGFLRCLKNHGVKYTANRIIEPFLRSRHKKDIQLPSRVWLEASTLCQLNCADCNMRKRNNGTLGAGYLKFADFKKFIDRHPFIKSVELSNNGEIFLNPELLDIIKYGYEKGITLTAGNGVNFNTVSEEMLEALVKYRFNFINFSIDGASRETYSIYRRNGNFDKVIGNIKRLNEYKQAYKSEFPLLQWQFILMNHNQDDVPKVKELAKELGMKIFFKLTWTPGFKAEQPEILRRETGLTHLSREEYNQNNKNEYRHTHCHMLWDAPAINYDGRLLGCSCTHNSFGINVFKVGLKRALKNKNYRYAKSMLLGELPSLPPRFRAPYIPCTVCSVYKRMNDRGLFLEKKG
jgi:MoaA/NifB/PqqE/SkfB family radical SAM enzyme